MHSTYATALASLADPRILPVDQTTARYFNRVAYDMSYGGIADFDDEGKRLAAALGGKSIMMMANHGVLVAAGSVAEAYDELYHLERACRTLVLAMSTGRALNVMSDELAQATADGWQKYSESAFSHFAGMKQILDDSDRSYAE